jgi:cation diffusion facilitator family transporter
MQNRGSLAITLCLGISILVVQLVGARLSGSLALLAGSVHVFADVVAVALALIAITVAARPTKPHRTFGLYRLEIISAVFNGILLLGLSVYIVVEAIDRFTQPSVVNAPIMIAAAGYGLIANGIGMLLLRRGAGDSLAVRGAYLEVLSDTFGSAAVVLAGVVIMLTGWGHADSLASLAIALFIVPRTLLLLRDSLGVLMENAPTGLDLDLVRQRMMEVDGVRAVHELHAWTITSGMTSLSAHVTVEPDPYLDGSGARILAELDACLHDWFAIGHTTFQLESESHTENEPDLHP